MERAQIGDSLCLQPLRVIFPSGVVNDLSGMLVIIKDPRDRCHGKLFVNDCHNTCGIGCQIHASACDHLNSLCGVSSCKLVVGIDGYGHISIGCLLHQFRKFVRHSGVDLNVRSVHCHDQFNLLIPFSGFPGSLHILRSAAAPRKQPCHNGSGSQQA